MSKQVGLDMYLYYNSATYGSPSWQLISDVQDLEIPDEFEEADVGRRADTFVAVEPSRRKCELSFSMVADLTDTAFAALKTRYIARTLTEFAWADGPIATTGTIYMKCEMKIFKFARKEPLSGAVTVDVVAKRCYSSNAPSVVTV